MLRRPPVLATVVAAAVCVTLASCSAPGASEKSVVTVGVAAAPSLYGAFTELITLFEAENPDVRVDLEVARSWEIAKALEGRTDLNVFASASVDAMDSVLDKGLVSDVEVFARNHVVLAVPSGNPAGVTGLADLARDELRVGLCEQVVPCGEAADTLLGEAGIAPVVDDRIGGSRALAAQLGAAELDAGIIYRTDVASSYGWVDRVAMSEWEGALAREAGATRYVLARVPGGEDSGRKGKIEREAGDDFRALVTSERGRLALETAGLQVITG